MKELLDEVWNVMGEILDEHRNSVVQGRAFVLDTRGLTALRRRVEEARNRAEGEGINRAK